jgi:1-acyl-sn-glycerol-3-phosphate acyltransferase
LVHLPKFKREKAEMHFDKKETLMKKTIARWSLVWIFGHIGMGILIIAMVLGWTGVIGIRIRGLRWFSPDRGKVDPPPRGGLVIYYRHISLVEALIVPFALYPLWLRGERFVPLSFIADYWLKRYPFLSPACIPLAKNKETKQGNARDGVETLHYAETLLNQGRIVCVAPTGTRQQHILHFKAIRDGEVRRVGLLSTDDYGELRDRWDDHLIGNFQGGIGWLAAHTNARFLPVWVRTKGWCIEITYGEPFRLSPDMSRIKATEYLERKLLELGERL